MKYFDLREFRCSCCGRGDDKISKDLLDLLDKAREMAGIPLVINSGYRCPKHNRAVGGVNGSAHTKGYAADIRCRSSQTRHKVLKALFAAGFRRIELAPTWIHVDVDPEKPQDVAFYPT